VSGANVGAWVLVQTAVGAAGAVATAAAGLPGVIVADDVTGPYDVIVCLDAGNGELGQVLRPLQRLPGVTRTLTCHPSR
jgi:hypothetical protein